MKPYREALVGDILQVQRSIFLAMQSAATPAWLHLDLTFAQIKGLMTLADHGPMTVGQVAATLGIGNPAASILVDRLVQTGLVERAEDPVDRRRTFTRLTSRGEELITQLRQGKQEQLRQWLSQISDTDLEALLQGLRALAHAASADSLAARP